MMRIGFSKDIHRIVEGRPFILGGIKIDTNYGLLGHSDADVLLHAVAESILGALSLKDLGTYFPDTDEKYKNYDSSKIVSTVVEMMEERKYHISNIDILVELEFIKLSKYIDEMVKNVAKLLHIDENQVSIKAATNEKLDSVGKGEACIAYSSVLLESNE
jgi:2-C-methyl-D-erythritol 2,4-cyclodiphosphate synthase